MLLAFAIKLGACCPLSNQVTSESESRKNLLHLIYYYAESAARTVMHPVGLITQTL